MDSDTAVGVGGRGTKTVMKPPTPPKSSDYDMTDIHIERVNNGVVVECTHKMKPEAEKKMSGAGKNYVAYDTRHKREKHAFNDMAAAAEFIESTLMGKAQAKTEKAETTDKVKVKKV